MYVGVVIRVSSAVVGASVVMVGARVVLNAIVFSVVSVCCLVDTMAMLTSGFDFIVVIGTVVGVDGVSSVVVDSFVAFGIEVFVDAGVFAFVASVAICVVDSELEGFSDVSVLNDKVSGIFAKVSNDLPGVGKTIVFAVVWDGTLVNVIVIVLSLVVAASDVVLEGRVIADSFDSAVVILGSRVDADIYMVFGIVKI